MMVVLIYQLPICLKTFSENAIQITKRETDLYQGRIVILPGKTILNRPALYVMPRLK